MTSSFSGLNTALSALYAQRRGLDVTGHNVANANTEGYSRQRVDLKAVGGQTRWKSRLASRYWPACLSCGCVSTRSSPDNPGVFFRFSRRCGYGP